MSLATRINFNLGVLDGLRKLIDLQAISGRTMRPMDYGKRDGVYSGARCCLFGLILAYFCPLVVDGEEPHEVGAKILGISAAEAKQIEVGFMVGLKYTPATLSEHFTWGKRMREYAESLGIVEQR